MKDDVLLTPEERKELIGRLIVENQCGETRNIAVCKAQCVKLLEGLLKEGHIAHSQYEVLEATGDGLTCWIRHVCAPDCWLCKLEAELKGER